MTNLLSPDPSPTTSAGPTEIPLSVAQEGLWISWQLDPERAAHLIPMPLLVITGTLDEDRLRSAVRELGERHPTLRGRVRETPQGPRLCWADAPAIPIGERHVDVPPEEAVRAALLRPMDVGAGPLAQVDLLRGPTYTLLLLVVHHIVFDGGSVPHLLADLRQAYGGKPLGPPADIETITAFNRRQVALARGPEGAELRAFWRDYLGPDVPAVPLPPSLDEPGFCLRRRMLDPALKARVQERARELRQSAFTMMFGAFFVLLRRYTGQDDLVVSAPFHGRSDRATRGAVGFFSNGMPIRHRLRGTDTYAEVLGSLKADIRRCLPHAALPLPAILSAANMTAASASSRTQQVMFQYYDANLRPDVDVTALHLRGDDGECVMRGLDNEDVADYGLTVMVREDALGTRILWKDPAGLVGPTLLEAMADDYPAVLEEMVADPTTRLEESAAARRAPRFGVREPESGDAGNTGNAGDGERPARQVPPEPVPARVSRCAAERPDAAAVSAGERILGYGELDAAASRLAYRLAEQGVGPQTVVAVCAGPSPEFVVGALAVLRAGGVCLPLDPQAPDAWLQAVLADAWPRLVLTTSAVRSRLPGGLPALLLDDAIRGDAIRTPGGQAAPDAGPLPGGDRHAPAWLLYAADDGVRPVGVTLAHDNLSTLLAWAEEAFEPAERAVVAARSPVTSARSLLELLLPLATGGTVLVQPTAAAGATLLITDAAGARDLLAGDAGDLGAARALAVVGPRVPGGLLSALAEHAPGLRVHAVHGYPETALCGLWERYEAGSPRTGARPVPGADVSILDGDGNPVPVGVVGELHLGGACLAPGYLHRPETEAERFADGPAGGARLLRTGTLARWRPDRTVEPLGRRHDQVELRNGRADLGALEDELAAEPAVHRVTVIAGRAPETGEPGARPLAGYVSLRDPAGGSAVPDLRSRVRAFLGDPDQAVEVTVLPALPVRPDGEVDRAALRALPAASPRPAASPGTTDRPAGSGASGPGPGPAPALDPAPDPAAGPRPAPPETATGRALAAIWSDLLEIEGVGTGDSFFELGGHSLLAGMTVTRVQEQLGVAVSVREVFEHPRLEDLAALIDSRRSPDSASDPAAGPEEPLPASSIQERIWFAERLEPGKARYNVPLAWRVRGRLDGAALGRALALLVERHEILRTRFAERDGRLYQLVGAPWTPDVCYRDLRTLPTAEREARLRSELREDTHRAFDPAAGRLLRASLFDLGEADQVLLVGLHHLVWDGESAAVFLRDLQACYQAVAPQAAPVAAAPVPATAPDQAAGQEVHPASAPQERLAAIGRPGDGTADPAPPTYHNLPLFVRLAAPPEPAALDEAVAQVVRAHEALRTGLEFLDARCVQRVHADRKVAPQWLPAVQDQGPEPPAAVQEWARRPFRLAAEPLLRVAVQPVSDGTAWLVLVGHLAVVDRVSLAVVAEDVLAALAGEAPAGSSYRAWLDSLDDARKERDLRARAGSLAGEVDPIRLPERHPRGAVPVYGEQSVPFQLPANARIGEFAAAGTAPVESVLLAGFAALLGWYAGRQEMIVGVAGPSRAPGEERVVGPLANVLPVRLRPSVDQAFGDLVTEVAAELAEARRHPAASFDDLVPLLGPATDASRAAPCDVLFQYVDDDRPAGAGAVELGTGYGPYDLHLFLRRGEHGIDGRLVFNGRYFDRSQMAAMAEHYGRLLEQVVAEPGVRVGDVEPLTPQERDTQLVAWNDTAAEFADVALPELLAAKAAGQPEAVALTHGADEVGYAELFGRAERIAGALIARGVQPGELVALLLPRGTGQVAAILGVLFAGAAYLPVEPATPPQRLAFILADSRTRWAVLAGDDRPAGLAEFTGEILMLPELDAAAPAGSAATAGSAAPQADLPAVAPDAPAYCIYTSGTTGRPKGVLVTHRNVVRLITGSGLPFRFGPEDVWTLFHSYAFDFSVWEVFGCLAHGGRLVVVDEAEAKDAQRFWEVLRRERVSVLNQTPSSFARLTEFAEADPAPLDHLRYVIFGGEKLQTGMLAGWMDRNPDLAFVNMYGITETTVHVTVHTVTRADVEQDVSNIGGPIPTTTVYLLDPLTRGRLLPVGALGEIHVGGLGVTAGYLERPELDAERFVADPYHGGRMFRSGDLARYRPDGTMEFVGRGDTQIQLRGYRVELGEIESCLREHAAVTDAVVLLEGGSDGRLVGYVRAPGGAPRAAELRAHLAGRLPDYMIPGEFRAVRTIPLNQNGKLDRPALTASATALDQEGRPPSTTTEKTVAAIWADLLDRRIPTTEDSFFELGGHSLQAAKLVARITDVLDVELPMRTVFEYPRLRDFAAHLDRQPDGPDRASRPDPVTLPDGAELLPVSGAQERIWFDERLEADVARYNVPLGWRVRGHLDPSTLERALALLVERHEILRTRFVERDGQLGQFVGEPWTPRLERADLGDLPRDARIRRAEDWLLRSAGEGFELASGRLLRAALYDAGEDEQIVLFCLHHIVVDGQSIPVFLSELNRCYLAARRSEGDPAPLPPPGQYREFVRAQQAARTSAAGERDLGYWADALAGAPAFLELPPPPRPEPHGAVEIPLPHDLMERLRGLQAECGVSWFMVVATAVAAVLHRWTGQDDVTFGSPIATRYAEGLAEVIGPCLNTAVLRSRCEAQTTLGDLLGGMRETLLAAHDHLRVPFEAVVERLNPARRPGWTPYIDVTLNMTVIPARGVLGDAELRPLVPEDQWASETKFGLTVNVIEEAGQVRGVLSYRGDRYAREEVERMARWLGGLLPYFPQLLDQPLSALRPGSGAVSARRSGERRAQLPPPGQYREFVRAQQAARTSAAGERDLGYWADALAGAPAFLELPPPPRPEPNGVVEIPLPDDLMERLRGLQAGSGVSWFMVVATAVAAVLHRWTGQDDVTFGSPIATRYAEGLAEVIGPCLNTAVLRSRCEAQTTLGDLLGGMRETLLAAHDHQRVPFEAVVERLNPARRPGWTPYIDVTLATEADEQASPTLGDAELTALPQDDPEADYVSKFALTVNFSMSGARLRGRLAYRGNRFSSADVRQLARLLGGLLAGFADHLEQPVTTLDLVDGAERDRLARFEQGAPPASPTTVPALVRAQRTARPDAPAVVSAEGVLSYAELDARARALAARLRPLATGPDPVVAILLGRGADLVIAMLAAWHAGCAFCPVDPAYPQDRVDFVLGDLDARAVVTDDEGARRLPVTARRIPAIRVGDAADGAPAGEDPGGGDPGGGEAGAPDGADPDPDPEAIAYILYTSGTTGEPKGVAVSHRGLAQLALWHAEAFGVRPSDRAAHIASVGFDATQWEVWPYLCAGAGVLPYQGAVVPSELARWLADEEVTMTFLPTPMAEAIWSLDAALPELRWMFFGAAALTGPPPRDVPYRLCNCYGPTEGTVVVASRPYDQAAHEADGDGRLNRIGRPITGARLYVLDPAGQRCPAGVAGEIHIGGAGVAKGYWQRKELTRERFLRAGPDGEDGPVYRTGDRGRWLPDGTLEYLGRTDRQLKIRGYRIEPQEIEANLRRDPLVEQAVVRGVPGEPAALVAYLVPKAGAERDTAAVSGRLAGRLPDFMVPNAVVWLDEMPISAHGKVDEARLPRPTRTDLVAQTPWVEPSTDLERRVAGIWSEVLGVDAVGAHDKFFDLGGNSLLLAKVHTRLQAELDLELPVQHLFEYPTVRTLAAALSGVPGAGDAGGGSGDDVAERAARGRRARSSRHRREVS